MKRTLRTLLAFLIAPLATPLVFVVMTSASSPGLIEQNGFVGYFVIYSLFAYLVTIVMGVPAWCVWRWRHLNSYLVAGLMGTAIGLVTAILLRFTLMENGDPTEIYPSCIVAGLLSGLSFRGIIGEAV